MTKRDQWMTVNRRRLLRQSALGVAGVAMAQHPFARALAHDSFKEGPVVETTEGRMRGLLDGDVAVFRGIRYGAPTGGANRFLPPKTPTGWSGVWDAFEWGPLAPQFMPGQPRGDDKMYPIDPPNMPESEDCLRLNIFSPRLDPGAKMPVMVWMHGGGMSSGSGSMGLYHGEGLARKEDVVVVTLNHRLNAFGYTYMGALLGDEYANSANAGMLDIVRALEWVRDNIASFGGDPGNVTIFGQSGGGMKVSVLMAMPAAQGLFHRAIVQSGPGLTGGSMEDASKAADALIKAVGLNKGNARDILNLPMSQLIAGYFEASRALGGGMGGGYFSATVDGTALPRDPFSPDATALSADIPLLIGNTRHESTFFVRGNAQTDMTEEQMRQRLAAIPGLDIDEAVRIYKASNPDATPWFLYNTIYSNVVFGVNTVEMAERKAAQPAPVYAYRFDWETDMLGGGMGAMHTLEISFAFNNLDRNRWLVGEDAPQSLADRISGTWAAFARTGDPNIAKLPDWPAFDTETRATMIFNTKSELVNDPNREERLVVAKAMGLA